MRNRLLLAAGLWALLVPAVSFAQTPPPETRTVAERLRFVDIATAMADARAAATDDDRKDELRNVLDVLNNNLPAFAYYAHEPLAVPEDALRDSFREFLKDAQKARVDLQNGAAGATSNVVRTGVDQLIGVAVETGAVSQTIDQSVATLRANADGLKRFLSNEEVFPCTTAHGSCTPAGFLKNLELSASFSMNDSTSQPLDGTTAGGKPVSFAALVTQHQFQSASARYAFENTRDLRSAKYRQKWDAWFKATKAAFGPASADLLTYVGRIRDKITVTDEKGAPVGYDKSQYIVWRERTVTAFLQVMDKPEQWQPLLQKQFDELLRLMRKADPDFDKTVSDFSVSYMKFAALRRDLESTLVVDPAFTLEYTYSQLPLQPRLHTARIEYAYSPGQAQVNPGTITFNAGLDYYHEAQQTGEPGKTSHWRDAQAAIQFDRPLGPAGSTTQLSTGFYYQYQMNPGIFTVPVDATMIPGTAIPIPAAGTPVLSEAGSIYAFHAALTIQLGTSGIKIPIGFSWANRTELVTGSEVRGHVGLTIDTSSLALLGGGK